MENEFPLLTTERFLLRQIKQEDIGIVFEGLSHPEVIKYYGVSYSTLEETQNQMNWYRQIWEQGTGIWWGICKREASDQMIGACGFNGWSKIHNHAEIGYWLLPAFQGKGIMREAISTILAFGFQKMKLHRIQAIVEPENSGSIGLVEKLGFVKEGCQKEIEFKHGRYIDLLQYAIINPYDQDYQENSESV